MSQSGAIVTNYSSWLFEDWRRQTNPCGKYLNKQCLKCSGSRDNTELAMGKAV